MTSAGHSSTRLRHRRRLGWGVFSIWAMIGCGAPDVSLNEVLGPPPDDAVGTFFAELQTALRRAPCSVAPAITARTSRFSPSAEMEIRALSMVARQGCALGLGVPVARDAHGRWRFSLGADGLQVVDGVLFVDVPRAGVQTVRMRSRASTPAAQRDVCGHTLDIEPSAIVWLGPYADDLAAHLRRDDDTPAGRWVAVSDGDEAVCEAEELGAVVLPAASSGRTRLWQIWEVAEDPDASAVRQAPAVHVRIEGTSGGGATGGGVSLLAARRVLDVHVGPFTVSASSIEYGCPGFVGTEPTTAFRLDRAQQVLVGVNSAHDPVLAVVSATGDVWCVDDTNGLNPELLLALQPGVFRVYVGSFGRGASFGATLRLEPR